jgi:hypothetical protein
MRLAAAAVADAAALVRKASSLVDLLVDSLDELERERQKQKERERERELLLLAILSIFFFLFFFFSFPRCGCLWTPRSPLRVFLALFYAFPPDASLPIGTTSSSDWHPRR